jgi:hypothetical protein
MPPPAGVISEAKFNQFTAFAERGLLEWRLVLRLRQADALKARFRRQPRRVGRFPRVI